MPAGGDGAHLGGRGAARLRRARRWPTTWRRRSTASRVARGRSPATCRRCPATVSAWISALCREDAPVHLQGDGAAALRRQVSHWTDLTPDDAAEDAFRLCFRLVPPDDASSGERPWRLEYLLQATDDPSLLVPVEEVWRHRGQTARFLTRRFDQPQERVLAALGRASRVFPPIEGSLRTARPDACALSTREAADLVRDKALLLKASGFGVLLPGPRHAPERAAAAAGAGREADAVEDRRPGPAQLRQPASSYDWQLAAGRPGADARGVRDAGAAEGAAGAVARPLGGRAPGSDRTGAGVHPEAPERPRDAAAPRRCPRRWRRRPSTACTSPRWKPAAGSTVCSKTSARALAPKKSPPTPEAFKAPCAATSSAASPGWPPSSATTWAPCWPTTWASARPPSHCPAAVERTRLGRRWSFVRLRSSATGGMSWGGLRLACACWCTTGRSGPWAGPARGRGSSMTWCCPRTRCCTATRSSSRA